ncbi:Chemotaxis protein methyltransferase [Aquimixticola soesokkakensis]|uniref:Chemotaxis protein methyltransferase n=1 Tax=Aquimixticola soesokkakensis TaxID=1519096 RepID=A0A1Y5TJ49_9RHOB|nr:protein-glutamate O-methyltransferase CheR [Aquimixticola soesokkakensis]SLN64820.1 Chemotaxis protein methyltransferase [Aquimixticola soesokkakensis]
MTYHAPEERAKFGATMSDATFSRVAKIAQREAGLVLAHAKLSMVQSRLSRRLRALQLPDFDSYLDFLEGEADGRTEMRHFISALTTNVSHFFREMHHFNTLKEQALPKLIERAKSGGKIRIWSAGCSNGQEPYSIAMSILEVFPQAGDFDIKILATDIDPEVLATARAGVYSGSLTTGLDEDTKRSYFDRSGTAEDEKLTVKPNVAALVAFRELNLHATWPMQGQFDAIFCRNVVIYFDEPTQEKLYRRYAERLGREGWLFLGHSERINDSSAQLFASCGVTTYRPTGATPSSSAKPTAGAVAKGQQHGA